MKFETRPEEVEMTTRDMSFERANLLAYTTLPVIEQKQVK